jgi:hypothetical protein
MTCHPASAGFSFALPTIAAHDGLTTLPTCFRSRNRVAFALLNILAWVAAMPRRAVLQLLATTNFPNIFRLSAHFANAQSTWHCSCFAGNKEARHENHLADAKGSDNADNHEVEYPCPE